jgi:uncharacterized protein (DUF58 family)
MNLKRIARARLMRWASRRHGIDSLPMQVGRRRIYIVPSRFGLALAALLIAMLIAGLNYNSNLGLGFGFLMSSLALVAMHHCHRNLLGLGVEVEAQADAFAGGSARFDVLLKNTAPVERCDIEILSTDGTPTLTSVGPGAASRAALEVPIARRGILRLERFELRTRYPFGWFRAWTYVQHPLVAYGAPAPAGTRAVPAAAGSVGAAAYAERRGDEEFAGLRAYEAGVPLKHMAWKVLARGGEPAVRSYTGLAAHPKWLEWSALEGLETEARLSQLCQWILQSETAQRAYGMRIPGAEIAPSLGPGHRTACLRALAAFGEKVLP